MRPFGDLPIAQGMRHAVTGGKGLRGFLVIESARLMGAPEQEAVYAGAAVEALHAYSLVHDDLPCMDDDDLRRGQPTVHKKWDEATAVLVGDALQTLAFELLARPGSCLGAQRQLDLITGLAKASGAEGMVLGQAQDMAAETSALPLTLTEIAHLQNNKTGALIEWSATAGAVMMGADPALLRRYAQSLGLAFQIADDILDVEGTIDVVGKATGKDSASGKATFVSLLGLEGAKLRAQDLVDEACVALDDFGDRANILKAAARFVVSRDL
ncbi:polyprenyl synthetase family protein [Planktomarina temperata]|uniref:polyprenyl synthetase family protein n=1 Tax=Planktomarina TaxID=1284657 RepID=UPI001D313D6B|nr:polyprenyl synthetase family protein [Planktomarina temperata]MBT6019886.1 polyprenyl synthetase family protein [Planktomarina temperata]MCH1531465.1 polyprenyl synthetase family protein [Planktomarina temperata]MDA9115875.1 polyprenyl synthetase family protein [Planktomarina temperata]MDB2573252.1 polyprenyl synthetase family protein [Planktomarina temperata]